MKKTRFDALVDELFPKEEPPKDDRRRVGEKLFEVAQKTANAILEQERAQPYLPRWPTALRQTQVYLWMNGNIIGRVEELIMEETMNDYTFEAREVLATPWKIKASFIMQGRTNFQDLRRGDVQLVIYNNDGDDREPTVYRLDITHVEMTRASDNAVFSRVRANAAPC